MPAYLPHENALYYGAAGPGVLTADVDEKLKLLAQLTPALGGLGASMTAAGAGELIYSTAAATYGHLAAGTLGMSLLCGGAAAPTWGTLGLTYGGTNANLSAAVAGGMIYGTGSALAATAALTGIMQANTAAAPTAITGTANYVPKWSAAAPYLTATSSIYDDGTKVGIGTAVSPSHLQIAGNISAAAWTTTGIAFDVAAATFTDTSTAAAGTVAVRAANSLGAPTFASTNAITVTDAFTLYVPKPIAGANTTITRANSAYFEGNVVCSKIIGGTATTSDLYLQTTSGVGAAGADMHFLVGNNGATEAMTILNSGYVGIGTTVPDTKLHVMKNSAGTVTANANTVLTLENNTASHVEFITPNTTTDHGFVWTDTDGMAGWVAYNHATDKMSFYTNGLATPSIVIDSTGNVGIRTTGPNRRCEILDASAAQLRLTHTATTVYTDFQTTSSGHLYVNPSGGNIGIVNSAPPARLSIGPTMFLFDGTGAAPSRWSDIGYNVYYSGGGYKTAISDTCTLMEKTNVGLAFYTGTNGGVGGATTLTNQFSVTADSTYVALRLGISVAAPSAVFQIGNAASAFHISETFNWLNLAYNVYYSSGYKTIKSDTAVLCELTATAMSVYTGTNGGVGGATTLTSRFSLSATGATFGAGVDVDIASDKAFYLGAPATDGTWRITRSGNNLLMERRESGAYVTKQTIAA